MGISHLGVVTDHVEPEDRRPGALLLAGVGDDDHREGRGLGCVPGKNNFYFYYFHNRNNKHNDIMHIIFYTEHMQVNDIRHKKNRNRRNSTCNSTDKPFSSNTVLKKMMCSSSVTLREICHHQKHTHRSLSGCSQLLEL